MVVGYYWFGLLFVDARSSLLVVTRWLIFLFCNVICCFCFDFCILFRFSLVPAFVLVSFIVMFVAASCCFSLSLLSLYYVFSVPYTYTNSHSISLSLFLTLCHSVTVIICSVINEVL